MTFEEIKKTEYLTTEEIDARIVALRAERDGQIATAKEEAEATRRKLEAKEADAAAAGTAAENRKARKAADELRGDLDFLENRIATLESVKAAPLVDDGDCYNVIDRILETESANEKIFAERMAYYADGLLQLIKEYKDVYEGTERTLSDWVKNVHVNFRVLGLTNKYGTNIVDYPAPVRSLKYEGGNLFVKCVGLLNSLKNMGVDIND